MSHSFTIPNELKSLIDSDVWPNRENVIRQNLKSLVPRELIHRFAEDENYLYLSAPPFRTVADYAIGNDFWATHAAPDEIDFEMSLVIGDFGIGSDTAIILNYEKDIDAPNVQRLKWGSDPDVQNHWVEIAPNFAQFATMLALG